MAMRSPWPRSTLPLVQRHRAVAVHGEEGVDLLGIERARRSRGALSAALQRTPASAKPTVSAPPLEDSAAGNDARLDAGAFMSASLPRRRHHGAHNPHMGATSAEIAVKRGADVLLSWLRLFREQRSRAHDHPAGAISALRHLLLDECGLHRMRRRYRSEPFERDNRLARCSATVFWQDRVGRAVDRARCRRRTGRDRNRISSR